MDAYIYKAGVWCGPCVIKALVAARKAAPGAIDMSPAEAMQQIVSANGFTRESDYGSDDLPKGPYAQGGGEADTPQQCEGCRQFLGNFYKDELNFRRIVLEALERKTARS